MLKNPAVSPGSWMIGNVEKMSVLLLLFLLLLNVIVGVNTLLDEETAGIVMVTVKKIKQTSIFSCLNYIYNIINII